MSKKHTIKNKERIIEGTNRIELQPIIEPSVIGLDDIIGSLRPAIFKRTTSKEINDYYLSGIKKVITGESDHEERSTEGTKMVITTKTTEITDNFGIDLFHSEIETKELYELCLEWIRILDDYYSSHPERYPYSN